MFYLTQKSKMVKRNTLSMIIVEGVNIVIGNYSELSSLIYRKIGVFTERHLNSHLRLYRISTYRGLTLSSV